MMTMSSLSVENGRSPNISQFKLSNILYPDQANIDANLGDYVWSMQWVTFLIKFCLASK